MKKKIIISTLTIGLLLAAIGFCFVNSITEKSISPQQTDNQSVKLVNVEEIITAPDNYKGLLAVQGTAISIDGSEDVFLLGCEDACKFMPVKYKGQVPQAGSEIIVYGQITKQQSGKYIFEAKEIKAK